MCESPKELAAAFACVVTSPSKSERDWVARKGGEGLFQTLSQILPEVFVLLYFRETKIQFRSSNSSLPKIFIYLSWLKNILIPS